VRLVVESDNLDEPEIQALKGAGIPVLGDRHEGLMHNKFVVLDRQEVWTGSMNFTITDGYLNDNHLVRLRSTRLAENYTTEFEEMFVDDLFGPDTRPATPHSSFELDGIQIETYFSPDDGTEQRLVQLIEAAESSVYFLAFSFTSDPIASALIAKSTSGVVVAGVFEESQVISNIGSDYGTLLDAGLDVRLDSNQRNMHHKVIIVDSKIVVVGSYNFSNSAATSNDENTLILHDPQTAEIFMGEFTRIFARAHR
jgi:phosphatidylserine/phosphatidylglycerophosphate/cardiolipin synthase-like enzyme